MADTLTEAMAALASVEDSSPNSPALIINNDLRTITIPVRFILGVYNDKDVLAIPFKMPRYYNAIDLSEFTIQINYRSPAGISAKYEVTDPEIGFDEIRFDWLLGRYVFLSEGEVTFSVCLRKVDGEGNVLQEFNTTTASATVLGGLEVDGDEAFNLLVHFHEIEDKIDLINEDLTSKWTEVINIRDEVEELADSFTIDETLSVRGASADAKAVGDALNEKLSTDGDTSDNIVSFTSADVADSNATSWSSVDAIVSEETHQSLFSKISTMFKNIRYLYKMLGTVNISTIGGGTITGAIRQITTSLTPSLLAVSLYKATSTDWEYCNVSLTVPSGKTAIVWFEAVWRSGPPVGIKISSSSTSITDSGCLYGSFEWSDNPVGRTPAVMLKVGTYYMFVKRSSIPTTENPHQAYGFMLPVN